MKNKVQKSIISLFIILFSAFAQSAEWHHQRLDLISEDGSETITVSVDYELFHTKSQRYQYSAVYATPVHINVWADGKKVEGQAYINALTYNTYHGFDYGYYLTPEGKNLLKSVDKQIVELKSNGNYLTGAAENSIYIYGGGYGKRAPAGIQEIAIVIDGVWYKGFDGQNAMFSLYQNTK